MQYQSGSNCSALRISDDTVKGTILFQNSIEIIQSLLRTLIGAVVLHRSRGRRIRVASHQFSHLIFCCCALGEISDSFQYIAAIIGALGRLDEPEVRGVSYRKMLALEILVQEHPKAD